MSGSQKFGKLNVDKMEIFGKKERNSIPARFLFHFHPK